MKKQLIITIVIFAVALAVAFILYKKNLKAKVKEALGLSDEQIDGKSFTEIRSMWKAYQENEKKKGGPNP